MTQMRDQMRVMEQSSRQVSGILASPPERFNDSASQLAPQDDHVADMVGKLTLTDDHAVYIGSTHWVTILEDVSCSSQDSMKYHLLTFSFSRSKFLKMNCPMTTQKPSEVENRLYSMPIRQSKHQPPGYHCSRVTPLFRKSRYSP